MKKKRIPAICFIICFTVCFTVFPADIFAYPHGYKRHTDEIYAVARHALAVYEDNSWDYFQEYVPAFTGIRVIYVEDSWREIEYEIKGDTRTGWVFEDDFYSDCLYYDGREKQNLADGDYIFSYNEDLTEEEARIYNTPSQKDYHDFSFPVRLTYVGDGAFHIMRTDTRLYLKNDLSISEDHNAHWGPDQAAGLFYIDRKTGTNTYLIRDKKSRDYLCKAPGGILRFRPEPDTAFKVVRTSGKVLDPHGLRVFVQYDADWGKDYYGRGTNDDPEANNFCTSACGIFAPLNAIYTLTGKFVDPHILADYAVEKEYRIQGSGTDSGFFRAAAHKFGRTFGFTFDGESESTDTLRKKLNKGDVAVAHVPGHYVAIVDYNKRTKKYLLLDSHYLPKRETCPYGDWVSASVLNGDGNLAAHMYYFFKPRK